MENNLTKFEASVNLPVWKHDVYPPGSPRYSQQWVDNQLTHNISHSLFHLRLFKKISNNWAEVTWQQFFDAEQQSDAWLPGGSSFSFGVEPNKREYRFEESNPHVYIGAYGGKNQSFSRNFDFGYQKSTATKSWNFIMTLKDESGETRIEWPNGNPTDPSNTSDSTSGEIITFTGVVVDEGQGSARKTYLKLLFRRANGLTFTCMMHDVKNVWGVTSDAKNIRWKIITSIAQSKNNPNNPAKQTPADDWDAHAWLCGVQWFGFKVKPSGESMRNMVWRASDSQTNSDNSDDVFDVDNWPDHLKIASDSAVGRPIWKLTVPQSPNSEKVTIDLRKN